ncbi:MAG TPA: DNRLRE domain-containing protein [Anaerohalosphaeraceae bacterium]|jgi:hypothetical protein|nr:DNRLRE domain-containing protein [Anaerohalosphaeraceae bacterium]HPB93880.1 DNRLRE domain-containing protein [Anaerohalosphaeraceae bacterium]HRT24541.1 DNRLRE domain-containing protein [Anaerohalosphaeraceae bacterium]
MRKHVWFAILFLCLLGFASQAEMAVSTADGNGADTYVGNDSNKGPNNNYGGSTTMDIRWYTGVRAHIGYVRFDITEIGGVDPAGAQLQLYLTQSQGSRDWDIYGLKDNYADDTWDEMSITYNTAPGMVPADLGYYGIDETKLTKLGSMFIKAQTGLHTSDPTALPLGSFLKEDTNNLVTLVLIGPADGSGKQYYVLTKEGEAGSTDPNMVAPRLVLPVEPDPFWVSNPVPAMNNSVLETLGQVCWTNPEPSAPGGLITCDVYFGSRDPNLNEPDYGLEYTLATGTTETCVSLPSVLEPMTRYYWVVDVHNSTEPNIVHRGRIWSFNTFNVGPSVEVGPTQYIWLGHLGDPATAAAVLDATVTDDGRPEPLTYLWEQVSGPEVTISPNDTEDITVVFTEPGTYVFRLTASDGMISASDAVTVVVSADACSAAKSVPGYNANPMDFNSDCFVDLNDFVRLVSQWLACTSLQCP